MRKMILQCGALALSLLAANVMAAVSPEEAAKLGTTLTAIGAEKAGNADGSIPAYTGGIPKNAGAVDSKGFLADPFANEKPLFVITATTAEQYKAKLSEGQLAMFKRYPQTYRIPVYPTHRTVVLPDAVLERLGQGRGIADPDALHFDIHAPASQSSDCDELFILHITMQSPIHAGI